MLWILILLLTSLGALAETVPVLTLDGTVDPGSADYLVQGIQHAQDADAPAVLILLNTPGGLVDSSRKIVEAELGSQIPVIVFVSPSGAWAGSAGTFITLAAHVAAMAPSTTIGAAHPVQMHGQVGAQVEGLLPEILGGAEGDGDAAEDGAEASPEMELMDQLREVFQKDEPSEEKAVNTIAAWARTIAEQHGRDADWAESAVRESASITERDALERGVIELVARDVDDLFQLLDGREVELPGGFVTLSTAGWRSDHVPMSRRQQVVHLLANPNNLMIIFTVGMLGLFIEFKNPGMIVPGVLGVVLLLLAAVGFSSVPFNVAGLMLVLLAFILFALEIWTPTFGAFTIGGIVSLIMGGLLLFDVEGFDLSVDWSVLVTMAAMAAAITTLLAFLVVKAHRHKVQTGAEGLVGALGVIVEGGDGGGWIEVEGETWRGQWGGVLQAGTEVRVVRMERLRLLVEPASVESPKTIGGKNAG